MTHDPFCPVGVRPWEDDYCCQSCNPGQTPPWERTCQCDLIATVRADEASKVEKRLYESWVADLRKPSH